MPLDRDPKIFPALCMKWGVDVRNISDDGCTCSSDFRLQGEQFHLRFSCFENKRILYLEDSVAEAEFFFLNDGILGPFDVVVDVENGTGQAYPELKSETHWKRLVGVTVIWWRTVADIVRAYPEFGRNNHELRFQMLLKWSRTEDDIVPAYPELVRHNHELRFPVLLKADVRGAECTSATCQFTDDDDDNVHSLESFSKDLGDLLDQNASADVEFRCADADGNVLTAVKAHKLVVCARSPVLAAMLHSDMVEGRTGVATVKAIDAGVFKQFLRYLYSGKLDETTADTAMSLYEAGDRFAVKSLTTHCAQRLVRNLSIENSCEVLVLADAHGDEELAEATVTFMVNRKMPHVFAGWEDFCSSHPILSNKVLNRFCKLFEGMSSESECSCSKRRRIG